MGTKAMGLQEFAAAAKESVQEKMGEGYEVSVRNMKKNNSVEKPAICICRTGGSVSAVFYAEDYHGMYLDGKGMGDIAGKIAERFADKGGMDLNVGSLEDYGAVKGLLAVKLVNTGRNRSFLEGVPHGQFLDLSIVPVIVVDTGNGERGTVTVQRWNARYWGVGGGGDPSPGEGKYAENRAI